MDNSKKKTDYGQMRYEQINHQACVNCGRILDVFSDSFKFERVEGERVFAKCGYCGEVQDVTGGTNRMKKTVWLANMTGSSPKLSAFSAIKVKPPKQVKRSKNG